MNGIPICNVKMRSDWLNVHILFLLQLSAALCCNGCAVSVQCGWLVSIQAVKANSTVHLYLAHNKLELSFDMMENSKTGKAAEADIIIGIGRNSNSDAENKIRTLCISKNKINGYHGEPSCTIRRSISRYEVWLV